MGGAGVTELGSPGGQGSARSRPQSVHRRQWRRVCVAVQQGGEEGAGALRRATPPFPPRVHLPPSALPPLHGTRRQLPPRWPSGGDHIERGRAMECGKTRGGGAEGGMVWAGIGRRGAGGENWWLGGGAQSRGVDPSEAPGHPGFAGWAAGGGGGGRGEGGGTIARRGGVEVFPPVCPARGGGRPHRGHSCRWVADGVPPPPSPIRAARCAAGAWPPISPAGPPVGM